MSDIANNDVFEAAVGSSSSAVDGGKESVRRGVGPWSGPLPQGDHWDTELLTHFLDDGDFIG